MLVGVQNMRRVCFGHRVTNSSYSKFMVMVLSINNIGISMFYKVFEKRQFVL